MPSYYLKRHENDVYYIHWTEGRRSRRQTTGCKKLAEARAYLRQFELVDGLLPSNDKLATIAELWLPYDERHVQRKGIPTNSSKFSWRALGPFFGHLRPRDIDDALVERYVAYRLKPTKKRLKDGPNGEKRVRVFTRVPSTIRTELAHLLACLNWCADPKRKLLPADDVPAIALPPAGDARDRWLRPKELQALFAQAQKERNGAAVGRDELFLWLALETTARKSAILGLTWDRVDFETGMIDFREPGRPQTKKRRTSVPMSAALLPVMTQAAKDRSPDPHVLGYGGLDMDKRIKALGGRAGVPGVTPNVLRHTGATLMARSGVPLWHIATVLGNSVAMIEAVYAKHCPEAKLVAVDKISSAWLPASLGAPKLGAPDEPDRSDAPQCDPLCAE